MQPFFIPLIYLSQTLLRLEMPLVVVTDPSRTPTFWAHSNKCLVFYSRSKQGSSGAGRGRACLHCVDFFCGTWLLSMFHKRRCRARRLRHFYSTDFVSPKCSALFSWDIAWTQLDPAAAARRTSALHLASGVLQVPEVINTFQSSQYKCSKLFCSAPVVVCHRTQESHDCFQHIWNNIVSETYVACT